MNNEQKIILSLYYAVPNVSSCRIKETSFSLGMDMEQLLLLMKGVFDKEEWKYHMESGRLKIIPSFDKEDEYEQLVNQSDPELKSSRILDIPADGRGKFQRKDYMKINSYNRELKNAKNSLYFLNVLMNRVNATSVLGERENLVFYCLFSSKAGKEFVCVLASILLKLSATFSENGGDERIKEIIECFLKECNRMQVFYMDSLKILSEMETWETEKRDEYEKYFFINESGKLKSWIIDHRSLAENGNILDFIFYRNDTGKNYACYFLWHIVKISTFVGVRTSAKIQIKKNFGLDNLPYEKSFDKLDSLIRALEEGKGDPSFNRRVWSYMYQESLKALVSSSGFINL